MTNETTTNQLVDTLRRLADVIESENLQLAFASVNDDGVVSIIDDDFRRLFKGQSVSGSRDGNWARLSRELFGIHFMATVYSPVDRESGEVTIQL